MVDGERGRHTPLGADPWKWENPARRWSATSTTSTRPPSSAATSWAARAGLAEMTAIGIPVPAGFIVTTEACLEYRQGGREMPDGLEDEVRAHLGRLEKTTGKPGTGSPPRFGPFGRLRLDARDDGHDPQPRPERRGGPGSGADDRQRALCAGCVQASRPDVRECRRRRRCRCVRAGAVGAEGGAGRRRTSTCRPRISSSSSSASSASTATPRGRTSRRTLRSSFVAPSASSTRGTTRARRYTAAPTTSPTTSALR